MLVSPSSSLTYGGRCVRCRGRHALPITSEAIAAANALREQLEKHGRLDFDRRAPPAAAAAATDDDRSSAPSCFSTRPFLPRSQGGNGGPGRMLGVLLCEPGGVVLRAFSGQLPLSNESNGAGGGGWACEGWAGPVGALTNDAPEYARYRRLSDALTRRIESLARGAGEEGQRQRAAAARLRVRRRALSHALIVRVQDSYASRDLLGRRLGLREAYLALADAPWGSGDQEAAAAAALPVTRLSSLRGGGGWRGFPAGLGDCCAPKLLHEAALRGLRPVALAEFWFGAPPDGDEGGAAAASGGESASDAGDDDGNADDDGAAREGESKEEAWRRRQRRRVLRQKGARRRRRAGDPAAAGADAAPPTREHGRFYGPCDKCAGILGAMLCDAID